MIVAVVGKGRNCQAHVYDVAYRVGALLGDAGHVTVTGGLGGVMLAAARGAHDAGGTVIGIPAAGRQVDPDFPGIVLPTGLTEPTRNVVVGSCCGAMIACHGSHGTLQELAVAIDRGIPVASVATDTWTHLGVTELEVDDVKGWLRSLSD